MFFLVEREAFVGVDFGFFNFQNLFTITRTHIKHERKKSNKMGLMVKPQFVIGLKL